MDTPEGAGWTDADADAAEREGWAIFDCDGSDNGPWQIQAFDEPEHWDNAPVPYPFKVDTDAWEHIRGADSKLHEHALAVMRLLNPQEYDAIMAWSKTTE